MIKDMDIKLAPTFTDTLHDFYRPSEEEAVSSLLSQLTQQPEQSEAIRQRAYNLVVAVRQQKTKSFSLETFLKTYDLDSQEGLVLMCLAEALLRIPDQATKTMLIRDKIGTINWGSQLGTGQSFFTNLANIGLAASDLFLKCGLDPKGITGTLGALTRKLSEPVIRTAIGQAMKMLGYQFVMGETIQKALSRAEENEKQGYRYSYDMLGESALTKADSERYFEAYEAAIKAVGLKVSQSSVFAQPSISVKLSALHPRYEIAQRDRILKELVPKVTHLAAISKDVGIGLTVDAEESERLLISLEIIEAVSVDPSLHGWDGFGLAVQAYQKRAPAVIDWIQDLSQRHHRRFCVRLVKGAYWDSEIKRTQERGLSSYPVYTRKVFTDISYQVCAQKMLGAQQEIYPQFATHNARTVATVLEMTRKIPSAEFEFQRLHGMGEALHAEIVKTGIPCRIYAPVGEYPDLLAYLVRRLLENGANTSFVNKILDTTIPIDSMIEDPMTNATSLKIISHPRIPLPIDMLLPQRQNSKGIDLSDFKELQRLKTEMDKIEATLPWRAASLIGGKESLVDEGKVVYDPANPSQIIGQVFETSAEEVNRAFGIAEKAFDTWSLHPVEQRAAALDRLATLLEQHSAELMTILVKEGGKTLPDALSEVREAIDFCRYYAAQAREQMGQPLPLPGPTGETNQLSLHGRGTFVCISPWNFPLAIFLGQITAALVSGNCVLAKPAHQTPLIAYRVIQLAYEAGIPRDVLHLLIGRGSVIGQLLINDTRTAGVVFTGSTDVARGINKALSNRSTTIAPLIAETGGINSMIVDSSGLLEQVVQDTIISAFQSAGQRCSALRLLFIQEDIAEKFLTMLSGAMAELKIGDPGLLSTDIGPVIDLEAKKQLQKHVDDLETTAKLVCRLDMPEEGSFMAPQVWELSSAGDLTQEVFGPILHVVRFKAGTIDNVIDQINTTGYGLTLGVHSRIDETIERVRRRARVGNLYVNRSMIGAVVGVQPFGGEGLSGTGPKAGGPHYLTRFTVERTFTQDTTAAGGNASLLTMTG